MTESEQRTVRLAALLDAVAVQRQKLLLHGYAAHCSGRNEEAFDLFVESFELASFVGDALQALQRGWLNTFCELALAASPLKVVEP
jgi:hypothetical protein